MWLRSGVAVAVAPIRPLVWKPPHASGVALKRQKKKKKCNYNLRNDLITNIIQYTDFLNTILTHKTLTIKHTLICKNARISKFQGKFIIIRNLNFIICHLLLD